MVETVNGGMSFKDASGDMEIDTGKLFDIIQCTDDLSGEFAIHGAKYKDKVKGNMHAGLNHPKKPTKGLKETTMLRFRYTFAGQTRYATITIFRTNALGFAGCKGYGDETLALRDQLKAALLEYARETFKPFERFERDVPITINNSTFYVRQKIVIIEKFMNFLREKNFPEVASYSMSTRGLLVRLSENATLIILISGKNKVFGAKSEESMNRINEFVLKMYDEYDIYAQ